MKYIKLFENFFDFKFGPRLWVEADDWGKWQKLANTETPEELTSNEISEILKTFRYDVIKSYSVVKRFERDETRNSCINIELISEGCIIIYKFHDDRWMIEIYDDGRVSFGDAKFLCDSYEGLINWIEDWREKIK